MKRDRTDEIAVVLSRPAESEENRARAARDVFRACLERWRQARFEIESGATALSVESVTLCSRKTEEYVADFEKVCVRAIEEVDPARREECFRLFSNILGDDRFRRGNEDFEARLGFAIFALKPYELWPPNRYFGVSIKTSVAARNEREATRPRG